MKAIVIKEYGDIDQLELQEVDKPVPAQDEVLIKVRAFGINRAETFMRRGLWGNVAKITGIECVGEVAEDPSGKLAIGQVVGTMMGGMGRVRNGSYAEFTCVSASNVFALETKLDWTDLAALPESYATAWGCLHQNMKIKSGDSVFIRGGTSALALAAINIASNIDGVTVYASTRKQENEWILQDAGCSKVFIEGPGLSQQLREVEPAGVASVLDIIGTSTILDSLKMVKKDGYVCNVGFLGGNTPVPFSPSADMPAFVNLNFFGSFMFGSPQYPMADLPMQTIVNNVEKGLYKSKPATVFDFKDVAFAHKLMEDNAACGKIVVRL